MSVFQRDPRAGIFLGGDRVSGQEIRDQNGTLADRLDFLLVANFLFSHCCTVDCKYCQKLPRTSGFRQNAS